MVELCESSVDEPQLSEFVVDHHVVRLDVSMHNASRVTEVQSAQEFSNIKANIKVCEGRE